MAFLIHTFENGMVLVALGICVMVCYIVHNFLLCHTFVPKKNSLIGLSVIYTLPSSYLAGDMFPLTIFLPHFLCLNTHCLQALFLVFKYTLPLIDCFSYVKDRSKI